MKVEGDLPYKADIKHLKPVIAYPGLVLHTHKSFIDYCIWIKECFVVTQVTIYIHTWQFKENIESLNRLLEILKEYDDFEVKVVSEDYNSKGFVKFASIIDPEYYRDSIFIKRILIWYSFMRTLEEINKDSPEAYVFKVRSGIKFQYLRHYNFHDTTRLHYDQFTEFINPLNLNRANLRSVIFSRYTSSEGVDEILLNSSLKMFQDVLGVDTFELALKLKAVYAKYRRFYDNPYTPGLIADLKAPHGGPQILRDLINSFDSSTVTVASEIYRGCTSFLDLCDSNGDTIQHPSVYLTEDLNYKFFPRHYFPPCTNITNLIS